MANDINRVILVGRLTRDPDLKSTNTGSFFCRFGIAVNRTIYRKDAENEEKVSFFDCVAWGKQAEIISKYLQKGRRVGIDGRLDQSRWEDNDGNSRSRVEIYVENFQFLESRNAQEGAPSSYGGGAQAEPMMGAKMEDPFPPMSDDEVPF